MTFANSKVGEQNRIGAKVQGLSVNFPLLNNSVLVGPDPVKPKVTFEAVEEYYWPTYEVVGYR